jgi:ubiquinone/menaquinone biosynthesis C-methylase UbiE
MSQNSFQQLEHAGWLAKAQAYDALFGTITDQAIDPILDSFGALEQKHLLDVACGTGHLSGAAAGRGAKSEGVDFAATMVEKARINYPGVAFIEGNAEQLPYSDAKFDAVACSFGLLHLERPERAISNAWRVLKNGGRYTFTVWCSPDQGGDFFRLVMGALQKHGTLDVPLPPAPPIFRFADPQESQRALTAAGFMAPEIKTISLKWRTAKPENILELIYKSIVRTPLLLEAQSAQARDSIHQAIIEGSEEFRNGNAIEFNFPALMATARKT